MANWWATFGSILFIALGAGILGLGIYFFTVPYLFDKKYKSMVISKGFATDVDSSNKVNLDMQCPAGKKIYLSQAVITTVPTTTNASTIYGSRTSSISPGRFDATKTLCALDSLAPTVNGVNAYKGSPVLTCDIKKLSVSSSEKPVLIGVYDCIDNPSNLSIKPNCKWCGYTSNICPLTTTKKRTST